MALIRCTPATDPAGKLSIDMEVAKVRRGDTIVFKDPGTIVLDVASGAVAVVAAKTLNILAAKVTLKDETGTEEEKTLVFFDPTGGDDEDPNPVNP